MASAALSINERKEEAAELARRGYEQQLRLLDEELAATRARAAREAEARREAERRAAALTTEVERLSAERAAHRASEDDDRLQALARQLDEAVHARDGLGVEVSSLRAELEAVRQRHGAEGRARAALDDNVALLEREAGVLRDALAEARGAGHQAIETAQALDLQLREQRQQGEREAREANEARAQLQQTEEELSMLRRRHAAEAESREGLQQAENIRAEELGESRRRLQQLQRAHDELRQAESELAASHAQLRQQLLGALQSAAESEREARRCAAAAEEATARAETDARARAEAEASAAREADEARAARQGLEATASSSAALAARARASRMGVAGYGGGVSARELRAVNEVAARETSVFGDPLAQRFELFLVI